MLSTQAAPATVLVVGLNSRRPLDHFYQTFVGLVSQQVTNALTSAKTHEDNRFRAEVKSQALTYESFPLIPT